MTTAAPAQVAIVANDAGGSAVGSYLMILPLLMYVGALLPHPAGARGSVATTAAPVAAAVVAKDAAGKGAGAGFVHVYVAV